MVNMLRTKRPVQEAQRAPEHGWRHTPGDGGAARSRRVPPLATLTAVAAALGLLAWTTLLMFATPRQARPAASGLAPASSVPARDPRLIVQPRTVRQMADVDGLRLALTVQPLLPGPNRVVIVLTDHGRAPAGARVDAAAMMPGMAMRPVQLEAHEESSRRFVGVGALAMFGRWQITVHVVRQHTTPLVHVFAVSLDLPPALLDAVAAARARTGK